jgi:hypothetical protein
MNRFPKADDVLNSLIATTLSCVDFYRPTYFLLGTMHPALTCNLLKKSSHLDTQRDGRPHVVPCT